LASEVERLDWVKVGQVARIERLFREQGVSEAVLAGGFSRMRAVQQMRPDLGLFRIAARLRSFRDDALLRAAADEFESAGIRIVAPTELLREILAPEGHLAGPPLDAAQERDLALGEEVATLLGRADVGQTVVVKNGHVLALEAVEGTDACIRRGAELGGGRWGGGEAQQAGAGRAGRPAGRGARDRRGVERGGRPGARARGGEDAATRGRPARRAGEQERDHPRGSRREAWPGRGSMKHGC